MRLSRIKGILYNDKGWFSKKTLMMYVANKRASQYITEIDVNNAHVGDLMDALRNWENKQV